MRDPGQFDAFYAEARQRLLLQAFALTGDLGAARSSVRDAFIAAWHHWHKVSRQADPEAWVRPLAWAHAQRRHTAHFWHREGSLAAEHRATLDALDELPGVQRRALLLRVLAGLEVEAFSHELGLPPTSATRQLKLAAAQFAIHRDIEPAEVTNTLAALADPLTAVRLPRASIIRRSGTARRRAHTSVGVAATAALVLGVGFAVSHDATAAADLAAGRGPGAPGASSPAPVVHLASADLLTGADITGLTTTPLTEASTGNNTEGDGLNLPCQPRRFADPEALAALVRTFEGNAKPASGVRQVVERSADAATATTAYDGVLSWFADCAGRRVQLLAAYGLEGAGDSGALLVVRDWATPATTWTIGVARTGSLVTVLARDVADTRGPELPPFVATLGRAVASLCDAPGGGTCPTTPRKTLVSPPPGPSHQGMLQAIDLPPVNGVAHAWVGTTAKTASTNPAATTCDRADFRGIPWSATRTFLMPEANLPTRFGLSETVGQFADERTAKAFVDGVEKRMRSCEDRDLSASVTEFKHQPKGAGEIHGWKFTADVSASQSITYWVSVVRRGPVVAQVGFVPVDRATFSQEAFQALTERALARLENLPAH